MFLGVQHQETGVLELQSRAGTAKEWPYKTAWATGKFKQQQSLEKEKADGAGPSTSSQTSLYAMPSWVSISVAYAISSMVASGHPCL